MTALKFPLRIEPAMGGAADIVNADHELAATVECAEDAPLIVDALTRETGSDDTRQRQLDYLTLQMAWLEQELRKHAGPVRRNESAEHSEHGPQALEERERRSAAESRADMARTLLDRLPKVTSALMHRAHNHDAIVQDMERRHAEQLRKATSHAEMESIRADSAQRNVVRMDGEVQALRRVLHGVTKHGIDKIEAAIEYLESDKAA